MPIVNSRTDKATALWTYILVAVSSIIMLGASPAFALDTDAQKSWSEHAELSYASTGGNTDVSSLFLENIFKLEISAKYAATWTVRAEHGQTDGETTAESYFTELRGDYRHSARVYGFSMAGWLKDRFSGIDKRVYIGAGGGYMVLTEKPHTLAAEAGLNLVREEQTDGSLRGYLASRLLGRYEYTITEKSRFTQTAEWIYDFSKSRNWQMVTVSALVAAINEHLSVKLSHTIEYDNEPVPGLRKTDTTTKASVTADF